MRNFVLWAFFGDKAPAVRSFFILMRISGIFLGIIMGTEVGEVGEMRILINL